MGYFQPQNAARVAMARLTLLSAMLASVMAFSVTVFAGSSALTTLQFGLVMVGKGWLEIWKLELSTRNSKSDWPMSPMIVTAGVSFGHG